MRSEQRSQLTGDRQFDPAVWSLLQISARYFGCEAWAPQRTAPRGQAPSSPVRSVAKEVSHADLR